MDTISKITELDLHFQSEDPDMGLPNEGVCCDGMDDIIRRITEVKDTVKKINLNGQEELTEIPAVLSECVLLEELDLSYTNITHIPESVFSLPELRSLSINCSDLTCFPLGIFKAQKLEHLFINIKEGWDFPDEITSLKELKTLKIYIHSAIALSENMGALKKLEDLDLFYWSKGGGIQCLPSSFSEHPSLKKVEIGAYFIEHKPFDLDMTANILASCPKLECLTLDCLSVGKTHQSLSLLSSLKELELRHLEVEGNPLESIATLSKLEKLLIYGSSFKLTELPDIFNNLPELCEFSFAGNFIPSLPPSFYNLEKLKILEVYGTGITSLKEKIGQLKNLEKICLYDNMLETLPDAVFDLPHLKHLNIMQNNFKRKEIARIRKRLKEKGQGFEFYGNGQGLYIKVKKFRSIKYSDIKEEIRKKNSKWENGKIEYEAKKVYEKNCKDALDDNPNAIQYVNTEPFGHLDYFELCKIAVKESSNALKYVDAEKLRNYYCNICIEAAKRTGIKSAFEYVRDDLLEYDQYVKVCIEAALRECAGSFLESVNYERLNREDYERICWVAVISSPSSISYMIEPSPELCLLAAKRKAWLHEIPQEMRTYEICLIAAQNNKARLEDIPPQFRDGASGRCEQILKIFEEKKAREESYFDDDIPF